MNDSINNYVQHFRLPRFGMAGREPYILEQCKGQRVLHCGCADYASVGDWAGSIKSESWLHGLIEEIASEVLGVDIAENPEARRVVVEYLRSIKTPFAQGALNHLKKRMGRIFRR